MATQSEACKHIFVNRRRFAELLDFGIIGRVNRDNYDLDTIRAEYISHLRKQAQGRRSAKADAIAERKLEAEAEIAELNLEKMKMSLIPFDEIAEGDDLIAKTIRAHLGMVPTSAAAKIPDKSTPAQREAAIRKAINDALKSLADLAVNSERRRSKGKKTSPS